MTANLKPNIAADILTEFIEVIVHNILYNRKLYPESVFVAKRKYGVVVYQCQHPGINEYITEALKAIEFHARRNQLKRLLICFHTDEVDYEKFVIDLLEIKHVLEEDPFLVDLEQCYRTLILKLFNTENYLEELPDEASFSIKILTTAYSSIEFNQDPSYEAFPWTELSDKENQESLNIVPIHTIEQEFLKLQLYIEK